MASSFFSWSEVQDRLDSVVNEVSKSGSACYVTESGKPRAVIIDVDRDHAMMDIIDATTAGGVDVDAAMLRSILKSDAEPDA